MVMNPSFRVRIPAKGKGASGEKTSYSYGFHKPRVGAWPRKREPHPLWSRRFARRRGGTFGGRGTARERHGPFVRAERVATRRLWRRGPIAGQPGAGSELFGGAAGSCHVRDRELPTVAAMVSVGSGDAALPGSTTVRTFKPQTGAPQLPLPASRFAGLWSCPSEPVGGGGQREALEPLRTLRTALLPRLLLFLFSSSPSSPSN